MERGPNLILICIFSDPQTFNTSSSTTNTFNSLGQVIERKERIDNVGTITKNYTYENGGWYFPYLPGTVSKQYSRNDSTVTDSTRYEFNNLGQPVNIKQYAGTDRESYEVTKTRKGKIYQSGYIIRFQLSDSVKRFVLQKDYTD